MILLGSLLLAFVVVSLIVGSVLIAPANQPVGSPPGDLGFQSTLLPSGSGTDVATWYGGPANPRGVIVLVHALRGDRRSMLGRARLLLQQGFATVLIDLQSHGESPGKAITFGYLERHDVTAAVAFARKQYPGAKVGVIGVSLGGAASVLGSPLLVDAMVLESVYPSITEAVHDRISKRLGPLSYLLSPVLLCQLKPRLGISTDDLKPIDHIAAVGCPVLILAGEADDHTTLAETERIYETAKEPRELVTFAGAAHVDLLNHDPELYRARVLKFLERYASR